MKKLLLTGIAALLLSAGTAHAQVKKASPEQVTKWPSPNFEADCRRDRIIVHVDEKAKGDWPTGWELPGVQVVPPKDGERRFVIINDVDKAAMSQSCCGGTTASTIIALASG